MPSPDYDVKPKIVAAIPCFNNDHFIREVVSKAKEYVDQVIVVDDGSYDETAKEAADAGALVISHNRNKGYGEAIKSCFKAARANGADILVILDGDGQHSPEELQKVLAPALSHEADLVIGSRFLGNQQTENRLPHCMPRYREFGIRVITFLYNFGAKFKVSDSQSGFRAYCREIVNTFDPTEKGMSVSIETLLEASRRGFVIKEVPITCLYPESTFNLKAVKHGLRVALDVVRLRLFKSTKRALRNGS